MGRKETEEAIADSRAGRVTRVGSVAELLAELNADDTPDVQLGSTNVYADLGHADADAMREKAGLVTRIGQRDQGAAVVERPGGSGSWIDAGRAGRAAGRPLPGALGR